MSTHQGVNLVNLVNPQGGQPIKEVTPVSTFNNPTQIYTISQEFHCNLNVSLFLMEILLLL